MAHQQAQARRPPRRHRGRSAIDDDDDKNKVSSTASVDAEDSHLRAVGQRASGSGAYIPTFNTAGHVANWEKHYPPSRWEKLEGYIRFSGIAEDTQGSAVARAYGCHRGEPNTKRLAKNNAELA
ncbi:hypothetical protein FRC12_012095 [Ceratobasidium sp. 428]|nr:hypothetical protein FRC12_012095 [Ceratobasidium sp. 428]